MDRKYTKKLNEWINKNPDMPYMLLGARQVGKTYIIKEFCKNNFNNYIYLNLDDNESIKQIFTDTINPEEIMGRIALLLGRQIDVDSTAIFFDEIQVSERAISSMKYFNESEKPYKIICAGSLLGVALNRFEGSFPVGKVMMGTLYPMNFEEFLWANNRSDLNKEIRKCYTANSQMAKPIHDLLMQIYQDYLFTGGMPAAILEYISADKDIVKFNRDVKRNILNAYIYDMSKYTTSAENIKINKLYKSIPKQLNRENTKFTYKIIEENAKKRIYETSIDWLLQADLISKCALIEAPNIPLNVYANDNIFKIYMNDTGLLSELADLSPADFLTDSFNMFKGMLTENYVAQALRVNGHGLYYWRSKRNAEIDFLLHKDGKVIPIEVKSAENNQAQSLKLYIEKYNPEYSIKITGKNFGFMNKIKSVPLYAAYLI